MRKIIGMVVLGVLGTSAFANPSLPLIKVNCDDIKLSINTIRDDRFSFVAYWNEPAIFPNTPQYVEIGDSTRSKIKKFRFTCPDLSATYDGNTAEIKAKSYDSILGYISEFDYPVGLYSHSWYKYENIKKGLMNVGYNFNIKDFKIESWIYKSKEGDDLNLGINYDHIPKEATIGYKVDGGELKPLLFNRKISYYLDDLGVAKKIDIYHKYPNDPFRVGESLKRIHIDKENGVLRFYRNHSFPVK
ncbi:hypothetical protein F7P73_15720 [Acinetobacter bohemicus]|uniref:DKNYY family protein n=1 Tax=Acinetobacter bohemicus TaxID=1435036 RepID=A0A1I6W0G2_9GAMM|nr:hypothetical protein [Acinetobacter bohemicus]KAB0650735.1 hypothetical protein F7P73_15720 [Acinetobacter bohemicus]SFT19487.1 hypothetical protein SAMN05444586_103717 [Acinetobacter bohemicus]